MGSKLNACNVTVIAMSVSKKIRNVLRVKTASIFIIINVTNNVLLVLMEGIKLSIILARWKAYNATHVMKNAIRAPGLMKMIVLHAKVEEGDFFMIKNA
jgi:hypothetical protein